MSADYNCWDGWELHREGRDTILRGSVLVENENYVGSKTGGRFLPRTLLPEVAGKPPGPLLHVRVRTIAARSGAQPLTRTPCASPSGSRSSRSARATVSRASRTSFRSRRSSS